MFDTLSERLQAALGDVRSRGALTEDDVKQAMRQVRLALLEADVNFKVVKEFTDAVREKASGAEVLESLNPGQQVVKIVIDELTTLMGGSGRDLALRLEGPDRDPDGRASRARARPRPAASWPATCARRRGWTWRSPPATCTGRRRSTSS